MGTLKRDFVHVCAQIHVHASVCACVCMHVHVCVCMCTYAEARGQPQMSLFRCYMSPVLRQSPNGLEPTKSAV